MLHTSTKLRALALALAATQLGGCATLSGASTVNAGGGRTQIAINPGPAPTVVFEAGLGDDMTTWAPIAERVHRFAGTFAYNRPGYGESAPALQNPTAINYAHHLHELLERAAVPKPWILVGHSLGGTYVMTFAKLYPRDVRSVVLVDGTPPGQTRMLMDEMPSIYRIAKGLSGLMGGRASAEFRASEQAAEEYDQLGAFPAVPVILLRRSKWSPIETDGFRRRVVAMQRRMLRATPCHRETEVPGAGHYVHRDRPDVVVQAIRDAAHERCHAGDNAGLRD